MENRPAISPRLLLILLIIGAGERAPAADSASRPMLTGRVSTGWTYLSDANSLVPQLNALSEVLALQYCVLDDSQQTRYIAAMDAVAKNQFKGIVSTLTSNPSRNAPWVRQAYAGVGIQKGVVKVGRILPLTAAADAYPINGLSAEGIGIIRHMAFSVFGGTINNDYSNAVPGQGYDAGGTLDFESALANAGLGFTSEKNAGFPRHNAYFSMESTPFSLLRIAERTQYSIDDKQLGYSLTQLYWRIARGLTMQSSFDYYNRLTRTPPPVDTLYLAGQYRYSVIEKRISLRTELRLLQRSEKTVDVSGTFKQQVGNGNMTCGAVHLDYRNEAVHHDWIFDAWYIDNPWMHDFKTGLSFDWRFPEHRIDAMLSGNLNLYAWNFRDSIGKAGSTASRSLYSVTASTGFNFSKSLRGSTALSEEFGDGSEARTSVSARVTYLVRYQ